MFSALPRTMRSAISSSIPSSAKDANWGVTPSFPPVWVAGHSHPMAQEIVIPDTHNGARFLEIHLNPTPSRRSQSWRQVEGIRRLTSISFVPSGNGWLANSPMLDFTVNTALLPSFLGDLFRAEGFFYIDSQLHAHLLYKSSTNIFGVVSLDEKHLALLGADVTSNGWSFESASGR